MISQVGEKGRNWVTISLKMLYRVDLRLQHGQAHGVRPLRDPCRRQCFMPLQKLEELTLRSMAPDPLPYMFRSFSLAAVCRGSRKLSIRGKFSRP